MPKIDKVLQQQPREIARQVMRTLDRREHLKKVNKPVYDGDLSWKKVSSANEHDVALKYQPTEVGLSSHLVNPNRKLNII